MHPIIHTAPPRDRQQVRPAGRCRRCGGELYPLPRSRTGRLPRICPDCIRQKRREAIR